jgi:hypothetical protein
MERWLEHQKKVTLAIVRLCAGYSPPNETPELSENVVR